MNKFQERLRELRQERNLTLKQVAQAIGVSSIAVSRWENGLRIPSIEHLYNLAIFFSVSSGYLIGLED